MGIAQACSSSRQLQKNGFIKVWSTYRLDPISLAAWDKAISIKTEWVTLLHGVPCSLTALPPCSFLTDTIAALVLPLSHLKKKKKSLFIFLSILHYSLYTTLPFLCCYLVRLPSCSLSVPQLLIFHHRRDSAVWCRDRKGLLLLRSTIQDKKKKTWHNAHQLSMGNFYCQSSRSLVSLISGSRKVCRWSIIEKTWYMEEVNPEVLCKYIACSAVPLPSNFLIQDSMMCSEGILV